MKQFVFTKWLALAMCLCSPMVTWADETLSLSSVGSGWSATYENPTITYTEAWGGMGWWFGSTGYGKDYSSYAGVQVVFKTNMSGKIKLIVQYNYYPDGDTTQDAFSSSEEQTVFNSDSDEQSVYCAFDSSMSDDVMQIYIQSEQTGTLTLVSATALSNESSGGSSVNTTDYIITDDSGDSYLNLAWTQTEDWLSNEVSSGTLTHNNDATPLPTATLEYTRTYGGLGWSYPSTAYLDLSDYSQVEVSYTITNSASVSMLIYDSSWSSISVSGSNGTITCDLTSSSYSSKDFSKVAEIIFQTNVACTLTINSIKLTPKEADDEENEDEDTEDPIIIGYNGYNYLNTAWGDTDDDNMVPGDDKISATITVADANGGYTWEYPDPLNIWYPGYSKIVVHYTATNSANVTLAVKDYSTTGTETGDDSTITFDFSNHKNVDYRTIYSIAITADASCEITITSIDLCKGASESSDYIVEKVVDGVTHYYLNLGETNTIWNGNSTSTTFEGDVSGANVGTITPADEENPTSADLEFKCYWGGLGWAYSSDSKYLDLTGFYRLVVTYSEKSNETRTSEINTTLQLQDVNYAGVSANGSDATGTITYDIDTSSSFDPSQVRLVLIQSGIPCTLEIESIELVTKDQAAKNAEDDVDLSISNFYVWPGETNTTIETLDESTDGAVAKITTSSTYTGCSWYFDDGDEDDYWGVKLVINTNEACEGQVIRLCVKYKSSNSNDTDGYRYETYSVIADGTDQVLFLPFLKEGDIAGDDTAYDHDVNQIYIMWGTVSAGAEITIVSAELVGTSTFDDPYVVIRTSTQEGYGTYYNSTKAYKMPLGLTGYIIKGASSKDEDKEHGYILSMDNDYTNTDDVITGGQTVPAATPLLVKGTADNSELYYTGFVTTDDDGTSYEGNLLHGNDDPVSAEEMETLFTDGNVDDYYFFKLTYKGGENLGFYWGDEDGVPFEIKNYNRAWLVVSKEELKALNTDSVDGLKLSDFATGSDDDNTTGIATVPAVQTTVNDVIYNIQGVRVNDMSQKGIYIVNGKKIVKL